MALCADCIAWAVQEWDGFVPASVEYGGVPKGETCSRCGDDEGET